MTASFLSLPQHCGIARNAQYLAYRYPLRLHVYRYLLRLHRATATLVTRPFHSEDVSQKEQGTTREGITGEITLGGASNKMATG